jgi:hypothetical protein
VRVWDAQMAIHGGLKALPWPRYLGAMWILGGELTALYSDQLSGEEQSIASATLSVVRDVSNSGEVSEHQQRAGEIAAQWARLIEDGESRASSSAGLINTQSTLRGVLYEITGESARYYASNWVGEAAEKRWREPSRRRFVRLDPDQEVADDSPVAQTLARFTGIVSAVAGAPDGVDPEELRRQILER